jgi:hypothetical protein
MSGGGIAATRFSPVARTMEAIFYEAPEVKKQAINPKKRTFSSEQEPMILAKKLHTDFKYTSEM